MKNISDTSDLLGRAAVFAGLTTLAMFVTGVASIPFAAQFTDPMAQNIIYTLGRAPVLLACFYAFERYHE